jgi:hypothetical protein
MNRFSIILMLLAWGFGNSASAEKQDEIRYTRTEGFGRTISTLIIRPDSLVLSKYTARPRDNGDTIGSFKLPSTRKRFDSLWTLLKKGKPAEGIAPDSKVIVIEGRKNEKDVRFLVPVRPPMPEWARTFSHKVGELHVLAEAAPYASIALKGKVEVKSGAVVMDSLWLLNPGSVPFTRTASCALAVEGVHLAATSGARALKWRSLADTTFPRGISIGPRMRMGMGFTFRSIDTGKWYLRARWACEPDSNAENSPYREGLYSPLDSVDIGAR